MTFPQALARHTRGAVNTRTLHFAGQAAFADLEHAARKSGTVRHTPVRAFRAEDTVVIGLNFGASWTGATVATKSLSGGFGLIIGHGPHQWLDGPQIGKDAAQFAGSRVAGRDWHARRLGPRWRG